MLNRGVPTGQIIPLLTIDSNGGANVKARMICEDRVMMTPKITQNIFLPVLSTSTPITGDATAEMMNTKLREGERRKVGSSGFTAQFVKKRFN